MQVLFSRGIWSDIKSNIQFDEIDSKGVQHVLIDLTLIKANGPKCSYTSIGSVEYTHRFIVDSGASGNLLPLCLYWKIFPNVTQAELERSIDHRVQLLAYNKKVIKQLGVCYLHVKSSQGHTKLCKFFIVTCVSDSTVLDGHAISGDVPLKANGKCNFLQMPETITKDCITNHPK